VSVQGADLVQGRWLDPDAQRVTLAEFGEQWIKERPGLRPRTVDLYTSLCGNHIKPYLGPRAIGDIEAARVRAWRSKLLDSGVSATVTAKAYRLLRAILMTAVDDGIIARNPAGSAGPAPNPRRNDRS
jgi:hypothetical protein